MPISYYCKKCGKTHSHQEYAQSLFCKECGTFLTRGSKPNNFRPPSINNPSQSKPVNLQKKETIQQKVQIPQTPIAHTQEIPAQDACFGELEEALPENISTYLQNKKIKVLFPSGRSYKQSTARQKRDYYYPHGFRKNFGV